MALFRSTFESKSGTTYGTTVHRTPRGRVEITYRVVRSTIMLHAESVAQLVRDHQRSFETAGLAQGAAVTASAHPVHPRQPQYAGVVSFHQVEPR